MRIRSIVFIVLLLFIVGCTGSDNTDANDVQDTYRIGTEGLVLNFIDNFPPTRVFDKEVANSFQVMLEVANRGAHDIPKTDADFYISGYDKNIIRDLRGRDNLDKKDRLSGQLAGKSYFNPDGASEYLEFKGTVNQLSGLNIDIYPATLLVTACYKYSTIANAQVCIDPSPFATGVTNKVCTPQAVATGSQGAPIAISSIDVDARPQNTRFKVYVQNVGGGDVFKEGKMVQCDPENNLGLTFQELDYVRVESINVGGDAIDPVKCNPLTSEDGGYYMRLTNGQGFMVCEYPTSGTGAYTSPLTVELSYGYRDTVAKHIEIVKSVG